MRERVRLLAPLSMLALVVLGPGGGTQAGWTDARSVQGTTLHTGRLDLQVDGGDAVTGYAPLDLSGLEPGGSAAATLSVTNAGTVPMAWGVSTSGTGTNGLETALAVRVTDAATTTGATCGGTALPGASTLAPGTSTTICAQVALPADAPPSVAGSVADLALTARGTTTSGAWPDPVDVTGTHVTTATLTAPAIRCGAGGLGTVQVDWDPVPGATGYRVESTSLVGVVAELAGGATGYLFTGLAGSVTVRAELGSATWVSGPSNSLAFSALGGALGTCSG